MCVGSCVTRWQMQDCNRCARCAKILQTVESCVFRGCWDPHLRCCGCGVSGVCANMQWAVLPVCYRHPGATLCLAGSHGGRGGRLSCGPPLLYIWVPIPKLFRPFHPAELYLHPQRAPPSSSGSCLAPLGTRRPSRGAGLREGVCCGISA